MGLIGDPGTGIFSCKCQMGQKKKILLLQAAKTTELTARKPFSRRQILEMKKL